MVNRPEPCRKCGKLPCICVEPWLDRQKNGEIYQKSQLPTTDSPSPSSREMPTKYVKGSPREPWQGLSLALFSLSLLMGLAMLVIWWTGIFSLGFKTHCLGAIFATVLSLVLVVIASVYPLKHKLLCDNCGWLGEHGDVKESVDGGICPDCKQHKYLAWKKPAELKRAEARSLAIKAKAKDDRRSKESRHKTKQDRIAARLLKAKKKRRNQ